MPNLYIIRQFLPITADYRGKYPPLQTRSSRRFRHFRHRHPLMLAPQPLQHLVRGELEDPGAFLFRVAQLCKVQVYLEEGVLQNILRIVVTDHHAPDMPIERFLVQPYSQRTQRKQRCAFTKNDVRLWNFGTLKSHSLKVSVQIFTIFQHLRYRHPMVTFGMIAKWKTSTAGVERCLICSMCRTYLLSGNS